MNKTIASLAFLVSASSSMALVPPGTPPPPQPQNVCLSVFEGNDGEMYAGDCDETQRNREVGAQLLANGCAKNQASVKTFKFTVPVCTNIVQL